MIGSEDFRILAGGKVNDYKGKMPGVVEEAAIALEMDKPLYIIGAFGGAAREVARALSGDPFSFTANTYHTGADYASFRAYYNEHHAEAPIDLAAQSVRFTSYGLDRLAKNNGLTTDENQRLFQSPHLSEIIYLVFKGLKAIFSTL